MKGGISMFNFIKDMFKLFNKPKQKEKNSNQNQFVVDDFKPNDLFYEDNPTIDNEIHADSPEAKMTVYYVDVDGHPLADFSVLHGHVGDDVNLIIPDFKNYVLFKIDGISTFMQTTDNHVIIHYHKLNGKPLNIFFINYDTYAMIRLPQIAVGSYDEAFNINFPKLDGFNLVTYSGNQTGHFTDSIQHLVLYYRRSDWKNVIRSNFYIKLREYTPAYTDTTGNQLPVILPKGSIWKIFYRVTTDKGVWLNIGPNQWIVDRNFNQMKYPFAKKLTNTDSWVINKLNQSATFESNVSVPVYNYPGGNCLYFLHKGDTVHLTQSIQVAPNKHWFEINNLHYIEEKYIK